MTLEIIASKIMPKLQKPKSELDMEYWYQKFIAYTKQYDNIEEELLACTKFDFGARLSMSVGEYGSEQFYFFLDKVKKTNGYKFYFYPKLDEHEDRLIKAYIMIGASEFPNKYHCGFHQNYDNFPIQDQDCPYPAKIVNKIQIKTFSKISDKKIYSHNDGFVVSSNLAEKILDHFSDSCCLAPVMDCKDKKKHNNMHLLISNNMLPLSSKDALRFEYEYEGNKALLYEGTIIYEKKSLEFLKSFNYTCETANRSFTPDMIISKKFKVFCEKEKIKGVHFLPILEKETELYRKYYELVIAMCNNLIASNSKHRIGFGEINPKIILEALE